MTDRRGIMVVIGFFATGAGSLLLLTLIGFSLGIQVGWSLGCILLIAIGVVGIARTQHKYFFAGWLAWACLLAIALVVTLFV
jgi:hypothetical protein